MKTHAHSECHDQRACQYNTSNHGQPSYYHCCGNYIPIQNCIEAPEMTNTQQVRLSHSCIDRAEA
jgi:hypothetical protein